MIIHCFISQSSLTLASTLSLYPLTPSHLTMSSSSHLSLSLPPSHFSPSPSLLSPLTSPYAAFLWPPDHPACFHSLLQHCDASALWNGFSWQYPWSGLLVWCALYWFCVSTSLGWHITVHYSVLFPVARWLLCLLCTHKSAKSPLQVQGGLYLDL